MFEKHLWDLAKSLVSERPEIKIFRATDIDFWKKMTSAEKNKLGYRDDK